MLMKLIRSLSSLLFVALLLAASPARAGVAIQHWTTAEGVRVYFVETHALPMLDLRVDFAAGAALDPADKAGRTDMLANLLDAGAAGRSEEAIANAFADLGAVYFAGADADRLSVGLRTLSADAERGPALALVKDLMLKPDFPEAVLEREKARAIAALKEGETKPGTIAQRTFQAAIYGEHPYGRLETEQSIAGLTRDDLVAAWRSGMAARRATVSLVGDLTRAQAEALVTELFAGMAEGEAAPALPAAVQPAARTIRIANPSAQAHVLIGLPGMTRDDPDYYPLLVGNYVLGGGGFVSRLTTEVREKRGYAYSVFSAFQPMALAGPFEIGLQTKGSQTDAALKVVDDTLKGFLAQGPSAEELKAAKDFIVNGFGLRLDSNRKVLEYLCVIAFYDLPLDWLDAYPRKVEAVTAAQVADAFRRRVQPDHLITVVVGGEGDKAALANGPAR